MTQKEIERKSLIVSSITNLIITGVGILVFLATDIQALFLDCVFSLIGFISSLVAVSISRNSKKRTKTYPNGLYFLEPLYAILKSIFILVLLITSVIITSQVAYAYFYNGTGKVMNIAPVLPYTISMVILCFGLSYYNSRQNKKINNVSTILLAESKSNFIDGLQSLGVGVAIALMYFVDIDSSLGFLYYTGDFFITTILVFFSLKEPIKVLVNSFKELSNGTTNDKEITNRICNVVNLHLNKCSSTLKCDIYKTGMHIKVCIIFNGKINNETHKHCLQARTEIIKELKSYYGSIDIMYSF
jgi:Predicted Co/Zn/Cd cation transporters